MRRLFVCIFTMMLLLVAATTYGGDRDGGTESVFSLGAGARAMGMGNGFVGLANDASGVFYNPAGLPSLTSQQISLFHAVLFEGTIYDYAAYVYPDRGVQAFGIAGMRVGTDDIGRRDLVTDRGRFGASQLQILLSYGRQIRSRIALGGSLKLAHQSLDTYSAYGYGLDLGARGRIWSGLTGGIMLQDLIGARLKLADEKERTPFTFKSGFAYASQLGNGPLTGTATFDLEKSEHRRVKVRSGMEIAHRAGLALRGGYDRDNVVLGMGLQYHNLNFDYAYKFVNRLSDSHRFTLTLNFGMTREESATRRRELEAESGRQLVTKTRRESLAAELERADRFYDRGQLDSALAAYYRADAYADDKRHIHSRIDLIKAEMIERQKSTAAGPALDTALVEPADLMSQAVELYRKGEYAAAQDIIALARRYYPESAPLDSLDHVVAGAIAASVKSNLAKGDNALGKDDYIAAYDAYNEVLAVQPGNEAAKEGVRRAARSLGAAQHLNLGLQYFTKEKYVSAQREFKAVLQLDPANQAAAEYLGRIDERVSESTSLEDLQKDSRVWQLYLGGLEAFRQGDYNKSIELWEQVLEVYPHNRNTLENIAQARLRLKK